MRCFVICGAIAWVLLAAASARAGIVFEYHPHERPVDAEGAIRTLLDGLERSGKFVARPASVRAELGAIAPAPGIADRNLTAAELMAEINIGMKAQYDLRNDQAILQFAGAIENGHANPALLVSSSKYRDAMLDALVGLATTYYRRNKGDDRQRSFQVMGEVIRSFPDRLATLRQDYGPEPDALYRAALKPLQARGTGSLVVDVDDPNALIFVDEGDHPQNATFRANLPAGRYRVLIKTPASNGRRYDVDVRPNETTKLSVKWAIATALTASDRWVGFSGVSEDSAVAFARQLAEPKHGALVLVSAITWNGVPAMTATLYRTSDGHVVRAYLVTLDDHAETKATALADVIANGNKFDNPSVLNVAPHEQRPTPEPHPSATRSRTIWYVAAGTLAAGLAGGGLAAKFASDGTAAGDELTRVCAVSCTSVQARALDDKQNGANRKAIVFGAFGGVALAGSVVVVWVALSRGTASTIAIVPHPGGASASYAWRF